MPVKKGKIFNTYTKVENGTQVTVNNSDKIFIVDDCNVEWMSKFNWFATSPKSNHSYLARKEGLHLGIKVLILLLRTGYNSIFIIHDTLNINFSQYHPPSAATIT